MHSITHEDSKERGAKQCPSLGIHRYSMLKPSIAHGNTPTPNMMRN